MFEWLRLVNKATLMERIFSMSDFNIASKSKDEQDKVNVDLAASGVAYKERLNMPVVAEVVAREQPEHLRE